MALKLRRGLSENLADIVPAQGELIYTTDTKLIYVGDGSAAGNELTPLGSGGGGGSSIGITDSASTPVLTLTDSLITLGVDGRITGDLTVSGTSDATIVDGVITADSFVGAVTGNVTGNVIGDVTGDVSGNLSGNVTTNLISSDNTVIEVDKILRAGDDTRGQIKIVRTSTGDLDGAGGDRGRLTFGRNDTNGNVDEVFIAATQTLLYAGVPDSGGSFPTTNILSFDDQGRLGVGIPATEKLHVNGNAIVTGTLTADNIVSNAAGTPEISSASDIIITANSGAGNFEVDSAKLVIDDVDIKAKLDFNIEGVVMLGRESSNDPTAFVPGVVNAVILSSIANDDTLDGTDRVKEVFRYRVDRYSSGGEILLAINDYGAASGADQFLIKKFLFHDSAGDGSAWTVTEIGTSGNAGLFTSLTVGLDNPGGGIDFFLTFTLRSPDAAISSASMIVTGQTTFTSNPLAITISGY
jgi:hypothetical protein